MITFTYPALWLLLIPLLVLQYARPERSRFRNLLRLLLTVVILGSATMPFLRLPDRTGVVMVLADLSSSMPPDARSGSENIIHRLDSRRPADSRFGVIGFSGDAMFEKLPESPGFDGFKGFYADPGSTNLYAAMQLALRNIPGDTPARMLLITDGLWNGPDPEPLFAEAAARRIAVDYRLMARNTSADLEITGIDAPLRVAPGELYTISIEVNSPVRQSGSISISRGGSRENRGVDFQPGINRFTWRDRAGAPGVADYGIVVSGSGADEVPENNRARCLVEIAGRKPLLLLTSSPSRHLAELLRRAGFPLVVREPAPAELLPERLSGYSGVILENVPASSLGLNGMKLLAELVKSGSLGLLMTGGRSSFAVGGYYRSPLEEVLPVSFEQRQEIRRAKSAIMVALDRSGSMAMEIGAGTKMALANLATVEVLRMMAPDDEFGVVAVDSSTHLVQPLEPVSENSDTAAKIVAIEAMGGGIFIYQALYAATAELLKSDAPQRHLLLFADAQDSEEPGDFRELLQRANDSGITVSVVGLGTPEDCDAELLREIARRGGGICYFTENAEELPRIFVEDTFVMARHTFISDPVEAEFLPAARTLPARTPLTGVVELGGYNLCYARENAEILLRSRDEYSAPLAAIAPAGLGRVAVFTGEADGKYTGAFGDDERAGNLFGALVRWIAAEDENRDDWLVLQRLINGVHRIELLLDPERTADPFPALPTVTTLIAFGNGTTENRSDEMRWEGPDRLVGEIAMKGDAIYIANLTIPGHRPLVLSPVALPGSPEFSTTAERDIPLTELCASTGGRERLAPDELWRELPRRKQFFALWPPGAAVAVLLLLAMVAERRFGLPELRFRRMTRSEKSEVESNREPRRHRSSGSKRTAGRRDVPPPETPPVSDAKSPDPASVPNGNDGDELTSALRRARRRH